MPLLDQADWHLSHPLVVPENITLLPLPPKCPEPCVAQNSPPGQFSERASPVENIWQLLRDNGLSNRIFTDQGGIVDPCCQAWNRLTDSPARITSIGMRDWVHGL